MIPPRWGIPTMPLVSFPIQHPIVRVSPARDLGIPDDAVVQLLAVVLVLGVAVTPRLATGLAFRLR
jgi:hypothetical protein